jgi:hypothetical protein
MNGKHDGRGPVDGLVASEGGEWVGEDPVHVRQAEQRDPQVGNHMQEKVSRFCVARKCNVEHAEPGQA